MRIKCPTLSSTGSTLGPNLSRSSWATSSILQFPSRRCHTKLPNSSRRIRLAESKYRNHSQSGGILLLQGRGRRMTTQSVTSSHAASRTGAKSSKFTASRALERPTTASSPRLLGKIHRHHRRQAGSLGNRWSRVPFAQLLQG